MTKSAVMPGLPAGGAYLGASKELRVDIDSFVCEKYARNEERDVDLYTFLYIPEDYGEKQDSLENIPLVVHFPSADYACSDYNGVYNGALYRHYDCTVWASDEVQKEQPCFVVTIGANRYDTIEGYEWLEETYVKLVDDLLGTYNIDPSRIYGCSIGGGSSLLYGVALRKPDLFAGMLGCSFETYFAESFKHGQDITKVDPALAEAHMEELVRTCPCWLFCSLNDPTGKDPLGKGRVCGERLRDLGFIMQEREVPLDVAYGENGCWMWNGFLKGEEARAQAEAQIKRGTEAGANSFITLFLPNTIGGNAHFSWTRVYSNPAVREWLLEQKNEVPYEPGA